MSLTVIPSLFRIQLVCIERRSARTGQSSDERAAASAEQSAKQGSAAGAKPYVDRVTMPPVKARPSRVRIVRRAVRRVVSRLSVAPAAVRAAMTPTAVITICIAVTPRAITLAAIVLRRNRQREHDSEHSHHQY